jgi:hypothetical protein
MSEDPRSWRLRTRSGRPLSADTEPPGGEEVGSRGLSLQEHMAETHGVVGVPVTLGALHELLDCDWAANSPLSHE